MSFAEFQAAITSAPLREIALHWQKARGTRHMPGWKDIDPAAIAPHLSIIWSWKYDRDSDTFTGRLSGEDINAVFGKGVRGVPMKEFFADWQYDVIFARHKRVAVEPCFAHGSGPVFIHARKYGTGERIIMPLAADGEHGDGILGATVYRSSAQPEQRNPALQIEPKLETVHFFALD